MSLARDISTVGGATLVSRLLGFFRDMGIAAALGAGVASDAFLAVLQIANFFRRLLAEGALNTAFVPLWLRRKAMVDGSGAHRFLLEVLVAMLLAAGALTLLGFFFAPGVIDLLAPGFAAERQGLAVQYLRLAAPYVAFAGVVAVVAAALNAEGRFGAVALGVVVFNAVLLGAVGWVFAVGTSPSSAVGAVFALAILLGGAAQLLTIAVGFSVSGLRLPRADKPLRPHFGLSADSRRLFALAVPGLIAAGIPQMKLIAGAMIASPSRAAVSWLYYANRLYELPLGVVAIAITSVLVRTIAASVRSGERTQTASAQSRGFEIALGLALPAAAAFAVLAEPIARGLFERGAFGASDSAAVAAALAAICAGLPGHALEKVLGAVSFAHEDTRTPMLAALAGLAVAVVGAFALFPRHGAVGVAAAIAISGWVGATALGVTLGRRGWLGVDRAGIRRLPRIVLATIAMAAAIAGLNRVVTPLFDASGSVVRLAMLALLAGVGLAIYLASIELLGVARIRDLVRAAADQR